MTIIYEQVLLSVADQCQQLSSHRGNRGAFKLSKQAAPVRKPVSANVKVMAAGEIIRPWRTSASLLNGMILCSKMKKPPFKITNAQPHRTPVGMKIRHFMG